MCQQSTICVIKINKLIHFNKFAMRRRFVGKCRIIRKLWVFFSFGFVCVLFYNRNLNIFKKQITGESSNELKDWHDYDFLNIEMTRNGPGERSSYTLTDPDEIKQNEELLEKTGVALVVSNKISVTRALQDDSFRENFQGEFDSLIFQVFIFRSS
jgi:hypothetical protein